MGCAKLAQLIVVVLLGMSCLFAWGCDQSNPEADSGPKGKMAFHKPADFTLAVTRLRELHDQLVSEAELPEPISYTVVEVSHRHGEGKSHVHYHLADENLDHGHGDHSDGHDINGHEHEESTEAPVKHQVVVDVFTEIQDVARWLPGITSDSDMSEEDWIQVKELSNSMGEHLAPLAEMGTPVEQRKHYQTKSAELEDSIARLESLMPEADSSATD